MLDAQVVALKDVLQYGYHIRRTLIYPVDIVFDSIINNVKIKKRIIYHITQKVAEGGHIPSEENYSTTCCK